ncbi:MAG: DUF2974 domain-containing protein, partial [Pseudooceanicola sp.]|nr:DUF2974 domain-containing protein [Pseudooceanicola sp.]
MLDKKLGRDAASIAYDDSLQKGDTIQNPDYPSLNGYTVKAVFTEDLAGGLRAYALENAKGDIVIAFKGSLEGQDWKDDVGNLGWRQWEEARPNVEKFLKENWTSGEELTFAGHSLGGALAQYATYETALNHDSQRGDMNLLTLSGLGSKNGIEDNLGSYDPTVVAGVEADNIFHNEDPVPRLGGGHIGETHSIGDGGAGNDGVYGAHKATNYTDSALAGATEKSPDYYKNAAVQNKNPGVFEPLAELMFRLAVDGDDALDDYGWEELVEVVKLVPKLDQEIKETQRLVGDFVEGIAADLGHGAVALKDKVTDSVMAIKDDLTDMATRGLETAEMALKHGWDTANETWDEFTDWTRKKTNDVRQAIDDAKDTALDWFDKRATDFENWFDDAVEGTTDWLSDKSDQIGELFDWVMDQGGKFSNGVQQKWEEFKESALETADNSIDWLKEKSGEILDFGKQKFDEGRNWLNDTYDDLKNSFKEKSSDLADWAGDKLDELGNAKDRIKHGIEGLLDDLSDWWNGDDKNPDDYAEDVRDRSTTARTEASPLVLDLDGDGLELSSVSSRGAVWWDIDTDGMRERSGWVRPDDGLLAIDSNQNGEIDDHSELFGTQTVDGFTNLAVLDSNSDGVIDDKDEAFADLVVWRDLDQDGLSDPGELQSLADAGVRSIKLAATLGNTEIAGNRVTHVSSYTGTDGKTREISDVWFTYDNLNSISGSAPGFDPDAYTLPQLRGYGALADLRSAMAEDARLERMVSQVAALNARTVFSPDEDILNRMQDILFRWAGVSEIDPASRGSYVDARQVAFVEAFTDRLFLQHGRPNPAPEGGRTMTNAFETALFEMYARVLVQTVGTQIFRGSPEYRWQTDDFASPLRIDFVALGKLARGYRDAGADMSHVWTELIRLLDTTVDVESLSKKQARKLDNLVAATENGSGITVDKALTKIYPVVGLGLNGTAGDDDLRGGGGPDSLDTGAGNDTLTGLRGDDRMNGGDGNDTLDGGPGNDTMVGGTGDDTYIYSSGFDTIVESGGDDRLFLNATLDLSDLAFVKSLANDHDLEIYASGDLIVRIEGFYAAGGNGAVETLQLKDGTIFDLLRQSKGIVGTNKRDVLKGDSSEFILSDRIIGRGGDDVLKGLKGADVLEGEAGNDKLLGGAGDDILIGGFGNDKLVGGAGTDVSQGGMGNDIYMVSGKETIVEEGGTDIVMMRKRLSPDDVTLFRTTLSNDLTIESGKDRILVQNHFLDGKGIEKIRFRYDGKTETMNVSDMAVEIRGTEANDYMRGDNGGAALMDVLRGLAGIDRLYGYAGNDRLDGGDDNDYLYGGDGDDTLVGGKGDDAAYGGAGGDTYLAGPGNDFVQDYSADGDKNDMIVLPKNVSKADVSLFRMLDGDLLLSWTGGSMRIDRAYDSRYVIEKLRYGDGKTVNLTAQAVETLGTESADTIYGNNEEFGSRNDTLRGLAGDDRLYGYDGNDLLDGGADDDQMFGAEGSDTYRAGEGHDYISDVGASDLSDGPDVLKLAAGIMPARVSYSRLIDGDLVVGWNGGSVRIDNAFDQRYAVEELRFANGTRVDLTALEVETVGTNGDDSIYGNREEFGSRNDTLRGLDGRDYLYGYDGNDTIDGGDGDDNMYGAEGRDTYLAGLGNDFISDVAASDLTDGKDVLRLAAGIGPGAVTYTRLLDGDLLIDWTTGSVRIDNAFDQRYAVETLRFANGTTVDLTTLAATTKGTNGSETIYGNREEFGSRDDTILGLDGNDTLYGYDGDDTLDGGAGNDNMYGAEGADVYRVGEGDDYISDAGAADLTDGKDVIRLAAGILPGDVTYSRLPDGDLLIDWGTGSVRVDNAFDQRYAVETLRFANGVTVDLTMLAVDTVGTNAGETLSGNREEFGSRDDTILGLDGNDTLYGYDGDDTLDGGAGNDNMYGAEGADTYRVGEGDDYISDAGAADLTDGKDVLRLAAGIGPGAVSYTRLNDGDLLIDWTGGSVRIDNAFDQRYAVETLRFANGTTVDLTTLAATTKGTNGSETIYGNREEFGSRDDTILGLDGNDTLYGYDGDDTLDGGAGNDNMYGAEGADVYRVGEGDDYISDVGAADLTDGNDVIMMAAGIQQGDVSFARRPDGDLLISWATGSVLVDNAFDQRYAVEILKFAGGATIDLTTLAVETLGSAADETLYGNQEENGSRDDTIRGLGGNDRLYGYDGNDTLDGGEGDDNMYGAGGADTYRVGKGDDYVYDSGLAGDGDDRLLFDAGIQADDLSFFLVDNSDLRITWTGGSVLVDNWTGSTSKVEKAELADGTVIDLTTQALTPFTTPANQTFYGDATDNTLVGGDGNDRFYGYDGKDTLTGNAGDDTYYGANGADIYVVGAGEDYIQDTGLAADGNDLIRLPNSVLVSDVSVFRLSGGDMVLSWTGGSVRIYNALDERYAVENVRFGNGVVAAIAGLAFETLGTGNAETIYGNREELGSRNDVIRGFDGNDT